MDAILHHLLIVVEDFFLLFQLLGMRGGLLIVFELAEAEYDFLSDFWAIDDVHG